MKNLRNIIFLKLFYFINILRIQVTECQNANISNDILKDIFSGISPTTNKGSLIKNVVPYNKNIRPRGIKGLNTNIDEIGALKIHVTMQLGKIFELDDRKQKLTIYLFINLKWNDPRLSWNETLYDNVSIITTTASSFWLPDLSILNVAEDANYLIPYPSNQMVIINSNGSFYFTIAMPKLSTICNMNIYKYPYDKQGCGLIFCSWFHDRTQIVFETDNNSFTKHFLFIENPVWIIENLTLRQENDPSRFNLINSDLNIDSISNFNKPRESILLYFGVHIKRRPLNIMINGIVPCVILNIVILMSFPFSFETQIGLCMTSFLTFAVTGVRISSDIPVQSMYLPLINLYILLSIIYTLLGFIWFIIADQLSKRSHLPFLFVKIAFIVKKVLFWIFKKNQNKIDKKDSTEMISNNINNGLNDYKSEYEKCNFCGRCKNCEKRFEEEKKNERNNDEIKLNVSALNYLAFFILFLIVFSCNIGILIAMSSN